MNVLRGIQVRLAAGLVVAMTTLGAAGGAASVTAVTTDPTDPICIMSVENFCGDYEGHTIGTAPYRQCVQRWNAAQMSGACDWPG